MTSPVHQSQETVGSHVTIGTIQVGAAIPQPSDQSTLTFAGRDVTLENVTTSGDVVIKANRTAMVQNCTTGGKLVVTAGDPKDVERVSALLAFLNG